ncbi:hypothetical protein CHK_1631 [Christensenella hongkongensis]|uniref:Uncharacterized protein n=1 Tax=Christensenella hongkongensis TaxID=270498 RepID=A0A0M2NKC8_9FIRM|nr:hypothetical protein CHK_1631 [Christensenella hongkongensis]
MGLLSGRCPCAYCGFEIAVTGIAFAWSRRTIKKFNMVRRSAYGREAMSNREKRPPETTCRQCPETALASMVKI